MTGMKKSKHWKRKRMIQRSIKQVSIRYLQKRAATIWAALVLS